MKNPDALQARAKALHLHGPRIGPKPPPPAGRKPSSAGKRTNAPAAASSGAFKGAYRPLQTVVRLRLELAHGYRPGNLRGVDEPRLLRMQPTPCWLARNGTGNSTLARNLAHEAVIYGHTVLFTSAGQLLGELASLDSDSALRRRLRHYVPSRY
jgi:hypothetical protein